jgi:hypothetical protein
MGFLYLLLNAFKYEIWFKEEEVSESWKRSLTGRKEVSIINFISLLFFLRS